MLKTCMIRDSDKHAKKGHLVIDITRTNGHLLSPFWDTINIFKRESESINKEVAWRNFIPNYLNDINSVGADRKIQTIVNLVNSLEKENIDVYLACYCSNKYCHRFVLFDKIDKLLIKKQKTLFEY